VAGTGKARHAGDKEVRQLVARIKAAGGTVRERRNGGHLFVMGPDGTATISCSPGRRNRARKNAIANLRGIGLDL
jgi:hypothetical protein